MKMRNYGIALGAMVLACATAQAGTQVVYGLDLTGANIVGGGDGDAVAGGSITFDPDAGTISWSITYSGLDDITGWAIHQGNAGADGPSVATDSTVSAGGMGVYSGSALFSAGFQNSIIGAGTGAYFVIKTSGFASGAVRDQLGTAIPAPGAACVLGLAGIAATRRRR